MFKKSLIIAFGAMLVAVLLPATEANAASIGGSHRVACFTINKKGNYNDVRAGVLGESNKLGQVAGYASLGVSASCQRVNSIPVITMHLNKVILKLTSGQILETRGSKSTSTKGSISEKTKYRYVRCGLHMYVEENISYTYYDHSHVRAFWYKSASFKRC